MNSSEKVAALAFLDRLNEILGGACHITRSRYHAFWLRPGAGELPLEARADCGMTLRVAQYGSGETQLRAIVAMHRAGFTAPRAPKRVLTNPEGHTIVTAPDMIDDPAIEFTVCEDELVSLADWMAWRVSRRVDGHAMPAIPFPLDEQWTDLHNGKYFWSREAHARRKRADQSKKAAGRRIADRP